MQCFSSHISIKLTMLLFAMTTMLHGQTMNSDNCQMVMDSVSGNLVAVWGSVDPDTGNQLILSSISVSSTSPPYNSWSDPVTISDPATSSFVPILAINATGNVVAVWPADDFTLEVTTMQTATLPLAGSGSNTWSSSKRISLYNESVIANYEVVIDNANSGNGDIWVSWTTLLNGGSVTSIQVNHGVFNSSGGTWDGPLEISP